MPIANPRLHSPETPLTDLGDPDKHVDSVASNDRPNLEDEALDYVIAAELGVLVSRVGWPVQRDDVASDLVEALCFTPPVEYLYLTS